jgi:hypothetical protein
MTNDKLEGRAEAVVDTALRKDRGFDVSFTEPTLFYVQDVVGENDFITRNVVETVTETSSA